MKRSGSLRGYVITRALLAIPMLLILLTVVFLLMRVAPGDPITAALGGRVSQEELARRRHDAGYDRPLAIQYVEYLKGVATLDLGTTILDNRPMTQVIAENGAATLELTFFAMIVAMVSGVGIGLIAGAHRDTAADLGGRLFGIVLYAAPVFFLGFLAQLTFGKWLDWLPTSGQTSPIVGATLETHTNLLVIDSIIDRNWTALEDVLRHLIMPSVVLGLVIGGVFIRLVRVNLLQTMKGDYVEAARARGVKEGRVVYKHAFKNALVPVITIMGLTFALLLGGAVLTEETFNWPGIGSELVRYLDNRDYIAVQGIIVVTGMVVVFVSLAIDILNAWVDPEDPVLMASQLEVPPIPPAADEDADLSAMQRRRVGALRRMWAPMHDAKGMPKAIVWVGIGITLLFILMAIFATQIAPYAFDQYQSADGVRFVKQQAPSVQHLFGTNVMSTDVLSRVIFGSRTALEVVLLSLFVSMSIGLPLGLLSGYHGGKLDRTLVLFMDAMLAFPSLLFAIVIAFLLSKTFGHGVVTAALAISIVYVPQYFRVVRNHVISIREESYVEAARALGARPWTIMRRYVLQNVIQNVPIIATLNAADAILTLAALGFLGYGIQPTEAAEWGYDIQRAISDAGAGIWWTGLFPGLAIVLLVTGLTLVGEGLNDVLNPVIRKRPIQKVELPPREGAVRAAAEAEAS